MADINNRVMTGASLASLWDVIGERYGDLTKYWWKYRSHEGGFIPVISAGVGLTFASYVAITQKRNEYYFFAADGYTIDDEGNYILTNPVKVQTTVMSKGSGLLGKYCYKTTEAATEATAQSTIYFVPTTAKYDSTDLDNGNVNYYRAGVDKYSAAVWAEAGGEWEYIMADSKDAYPTGMVDGIEYIYLGLPIDRAVKGIGYQTGSYAGTGTYGASEPMSVTFDFEPWLFWIVPMTDEPATGVVYFLYGDGYRNAVCLGAIPDTEEFVSGYGVCNSGASSGSCHGKWDRATKTYSWYSAHSTATTAIKNQFNEAGVEYKWFALG